MATYDEGYRNGKLDYRLGHKLLVSWYAENPYGQGYRDGWAKADRVALAEESYYHPMPNAK